MACLTRNAVGMASLPNICNKISWTIKSRACERYSIATQLQSVLLKCRISRCIYITACIKVSKWKAVVSKALKNNLCISACVCGEKQVLIKLERYVLWHQWRCFNISFLLLRGFACGAGCGRCCSRMREKSHLSSCQWNLARCLGLFPRRRWVCDLKKKQTEISWRHLAV